MKIGLDLSSLIPSLSSNAKKMGIYRYVLSITEQLSQLYSDNVIFFVHDLKPFEQLPHNSILNKLTLKKWTSNSLELDIIHYPEETLLRSFTQEKPILFQNLHDLIPLIYPQFYTIKRLSLISSLVNQLGKKDWVLCPSFATKNDILHYLHLDPEKVIPIHSAISPKLFYPSYDQTLFELMLNTYSIPNAPYFVSVGRIEERKNTIHLLRAFMRLIQEEKINDLNLVLIGPMNQLSDSIIHFFQDEVIKKGYQARVIHIPYMEDRFLAVLYSYALACIFVPVYEGFGFPCLEAMQCGTPLIASNNSSIPEVTGDAALLIPHDEEITLCDKMLTLYSSATKREYYRNEGIKRARQFSWEKHIKQLITAYRKALFY